MGYFYHIAETKHHLKETDEELKGRPDIECFSFSMLYFNFITIAKPICSNKIHFYL